MAIERLLKVVGPVLFTADGTNSGLVTVASTKGFKVKAEVILSGTSLNTLSLEVKRVISKTQLIVGEKGNIKSRADMSAYTVALGSSIFQPEQNRPGIPTEQHERAVYEEEPTLAKRVILVDELGYFYDTDNPLKVQLTDGSIDIGTVNADVDVQLTDKESAPGENDYDITRIGDGEDQLNINADGSINVNIVESDKSLEQSLNIYDEALNVTSGLETLIVSFSATDGSKRYSLMRSEFTGEQIGLYRLYKNGQNIATKRTHHGSGLSGVFEFIGGSQEGIFLANNDVIELKVLHNRPGLGNFEGRIQIFESSTISPPVSLLTEMDEFFLTENGDNIILE